MGDVYTHGHQDSVLRSHRWRTAANSAAYLIGSLQPGQRLLDVGCGPGTITVDLARLVAPGPAVGIDVSEPVLDEARMAAMQAGVANLKFAVGDVYDLAYGDATFEVAHAHQVLQHLSDPVRALRELHRVLAPGGIIAVRDGDYGAFRWEPEDPDLDHWLDLYHRVTARNGAEADAGRFLAGWVEEAEFGTVTATSSEWRFDDPDSRRWWGGLWAERCSSSSFAEQALAYGLATADDLQRISRAWLRWAEAPDAWFVVPHGEVLARR